MSKKRQNVQRRVSPRVDRLFKTGLAALILVALLVTFWPESTTDQDGNDSEAPVTAKEDSKQIAAAPPAPAPSAPTNNVKENEVDVSSIATQATAAYVDQLLKTGAAEEVASFAMTLLERQDYTNAANLFVRATELEEFNEFHQFNLGVVLSRMNRREEAKAAYLKALEILPDYPEAHNNLGNIYSLEGNIAEAEKHYQEAIDIDPENASSQNNMGSLLVRKKQHSRALGYFEKALSLNSNYVEAKFNVASALLYLGHTNEATGQLKDLINAHPDFVPAQITLMRLESER